MNRFHQSVVVFACLALGASTAVLAVPGEVTNLQWCSGPKSCLQWSAVIGATQYKAYRGEWASLPCILSPSLDSCDHGIIATTSTGTTIPENPAAGRFFWFIVCARDGSGEGTPGLATAGPRTVNDSGACMAGCAPSGSSCTVDNDCCSSNCIAGTCQSACCQPTAGFCTTHSDCCSGVCSAGQCQAPCTPNGGTCFVHAECCSSFCQAGLCTNLVCNPGFADCNNNPVDGCEINITSSPQNCGQCGRTCSPNNIPVPTCSGGVCNGACASGFADCNFNKQVDGCEVNTTTSPQNCGGCGLACSFQNASASCVNSQCTMGACAPGYADCNSNPADGCEINVTSSPQNCALCGRTCSPNNIPVPTCSGGVCNGACASGFADCNFNKQADGCEVSTTTSPQNCGGCGLVCTFQNASASCVNSQCTMGACAPGYADCNSNPADGCEINVTSSPQNCGLCGTTCSPNNVPVPTCSGGACNGACASGFSDCNFNKQTDGCETGTTSDPQNCGGCNLSCNFANATAACVSSSCTIVSCNSGFGDCNANPADGCEVNTNTSPSHCGGCGLACSSNNVPSPVCTSGNCTGACATGFADCNNDRQTDGCEVNTQNDVNNCGTCGNACVIGAICGAGSCFIP